MSIKIYVFECPSCEKDFEFRDEYHKIIKIKCPHCKDTLQARYEETTTGVYVYIVKELK